MFIGVDTEESRGGSIYSVTKLSFEYLCFMVGFFILFSWIMLLQMFVTGSMFTVLLMDGVEGVRWEDRCKQVIIPSSNNLFTHGR